MDATSARDRLEQRLAALDALADGGGTDAGVVDLDQQRVGRLTRMDALQASAMAGATRARREAERRRIVAALARIERSEYGRCVDCDEPIPPGRLDVDPAALRCVRCAEAEGGR